MSGGKVKRIDARALKAQLHDGGELMGVGHAISVAHLDRFTYRPL